MIHADDDPSAAGNNPFDGLDGNLFFTRAWPGTLRELASAMVKYDYAEDHIIVNSFQPQYVAELMDAGFLPMLYEMRKADIPMGCWDSPRAALWLCHPQEYHARAITTGLRSPDPISTPIDTLFQLSPRKWRKLLGGHKYFLTVNVAFNHTLAMAAAYHATRRATWIAGDLEMTMRALTLATSAPSITQAHSIELWVQHADGEPVVLAAGEIGYTTDGVYTAMSGFRTLPNSGTVQLYASAARMRACGIGLWDLGMVMNYKTMLGFSGVDRPTYYAARAAVLDRGAPAGLQDSTPVASAVDPSSDKFVMTTLGAEPLQAAALAAVGCTVTFATEATAAASSVHAIHATRAAEAARAADPSAAVATPPRPAVTPSVLATLALPIPRPPGSRASGGSSAGPDEVRSDADCMQAARSIKNFGCVRAPYQPTPGVVNGVDVTQYPVEPLMFLLPRRVSVANPDSKRQKKRAARRAARATARAAKREKGSA